MTSKLSILSTNSDVRVRLARGLLLASRQTLDGNTVLSVVLTDLEDLDRGRVHRNISIRQNPAPLPKAHDPLNCVKIEQDLFASPGGSDYLQ